ncbi:hypothetical protein K435DRAFT_445664 [Dendrothele bispora CBS 962.96]|uniref:Uncharacterized protein n=1 Tax=Dendrothele bispora (strain CBS 962.96) TaxID=1314807 RepID=A0A4S8L2B9_DENBC|nr:hypothetical protein K435DRAFT_445664 [Dendrothele bispora CBS 962.96]
MWTKFFDYSLFSFSPCTILFSYFYHLPHLSLGLPILLSRISLLNHTLACCIAVTRSDHEHSLIFYPILHLQQMDHIASRTHATPSLIYTQRTPFLYDLLLPISISLPSQATSLSIYRLYLAIPFQLLFHILFFVGTYNNGLGLWSNCRRV